MADAHIEQPPPQVSLRKLSSDIRTMGAVYPRITFLLTSRDALLISSAIDRSFEPPPEPVVIQPPDPAADWLRPTFLCLVLINALPQLVPAAAEIARLLWAM